MHALGESCCLGSTVTQSECGNHVALGGGADTCTTSFESLSTYFFPQVTLGLLHLGTFRVGVNLGENRVDFLHFQVDDIVHDALCLGDMLPKQVKVKLSLRGKRIFHIAVKVHGKKAAAVVRTQRNLAAGIGGNGTETEIGIAVGHRLADNRIPKQHTRLSRLPGIVDYLSPYSGCIHLFCHNRLRRAVDGIGLQIRLPLHGSLHEFIVDAHRDIRAGHLSLGHLGIDKRLAVGVLDAYSHHQRPAPAILRHLTGRIGVTLHKRYKSGRCKRRIFNGSALRTDMAEVVPYPAAALH